MKEAVDMVQKRSKQRTAADVSQVPGTTLGRHLKGKLEKLSGSKQLGKSYILGTEKEMKLVNCVIEFEKRGVPPDNRRHPDISLRIN